MGSSHRFMPETEQRKLFRRLPLGEIVGSGAVEPMGRGCAQHEGFYAECGACQQAWSRSPSYQALIDVLVKCWMTGETTEELRKEIDSTLTSAGCNPAADEGGGVRSEHRLRDNAAWDKERAT